MKPAKEDSDHAWSRNRKIVIPESSIKVRRYIVVFKDAPKQLQHQITIIQDDRFYTYDLRFVKPLLHQVTKSNVHRIIFPATI
jgi:hypothetical protein